MGLGLLNTAQLTQLLAVALDEATPKDGLPIWDSRLGGEDLCHAPSPLPDGRKLLGSSRIITSPTLTNGGPCQSRAWHHGQTRVGGEMVGTQTGTYPHLKRKTIEWMLADTRITQLATNTTLATATRFDTASKTIYFPETAERVIESARLVMTYRTEWAATNSVTGWRMGFQIGASPTVDFDRVISAVNTASRNIVDEIDCNVTEQVRQYIGSGTSIACVASIAVASTNAAFINQITFKLVVTYAFDGVGSPTRLRQIKIPIQSMATFLSTVQQEFGTDGVNPVGTGQIPILNNLPELSKTFRQIYFEAHAHDCVPAIASNVTPFLQVDAVAETARATIDTTIVPNHMWRDQIDLTGLDTSITHTLKMRCDVNQRLFGIGGFVVVIFEYDHPTTLANNRATYAMPYVPFVNSLSDERLAGSGEAVDILNTANRFVALLDIQEPGPITLLQSGVFVMWSLNGAGGNASITTKLAQQTAARTWTHFQASTGPSPFVLRTDAAWPIARGLNRWTLDTNGGVGRTVRHAYAVINYTAGIRGDVDNGNHVLNYAVHSADQVASGQTPVTADAWGNLPPVFGLPYKINTAAIDLAIRMAATVVDSFALQQLDGELDSSYSRSSTNDQSNSQATQTQKHLIAFTRSVNRDNLSGGKIDLTRRRTHVALGTNNAGSYIALVAWSWWIGYHQHAFTIAGSVTIDGVAAGAGKSIKIFAYDQVAAGLYRDGLTTARDTAELITTVTTDATGAYTASVPDSTRSYFASYDNDSRYGRSAAITPDGTANIAIGAAPTAPGYSRSRVVNV